MRSVAFVPACEDLPVKALLSLPGADTSGVLIQQGVNGSVQTVLPVLIPEIQDPSASSPATFPGDTTPIFEPPTDPNQLLPLPPSGGSIMA